MVRREVADDACLLVHVDVEVHVQTRDVGAVERLGDGVAEVAKLHEVVQFRVGRQLCVPHDVGHVRGSQHVDLSPQP